MSYNMEVKGPRGLFRINLQQDDGLWSVVHRLSDNPYLRLPQFIGVYRTHEEALESARRHAHGNSFAGEPIINPLPDRRGLVAHTKAKS